MRLPEIISVSPPIEGVTSTGRCVTLAVQLLSTGFTRGLMMFAKRVRSALLVPFICLIQACGGGGDAEPPERLASGIDGVAQKGPLMQGSTVLVSLLNAKTWQPSGSTYVFAISNNLGNFSSSSTVFSSQYAESTATGYYLNELTGKPSGDIITVRGLSDLVNDKAINLNVLTSIVRSRMRTLMTRSTNKLGFAAARSQAQKELLETFFIYNSASLMPGGANQPSSFNEIDIAKGRAADQVLAAISAIMMSIGQDGNGTTLWLSRLESDLADDGLINNSPGYSPSPVELLQRAQRDVNLRAVAGTLNSFYGSNGFAEDSIAQWNDSSGGQDRVIDRHKYSAVGIEPGAAAVSPSFAAGSDDAGQCFSVTGGVLYRNGIPVAGSVKAANGDAFTISIAAPSQPGVSTSAFIQRTAPSTAGLCTAVVGLAGQTRVAKFSVTTKAASVLSLAAGVGHSLAVRADGTLWAWGRNDYGQLGDGTTTGTATPKQIGTGFVAVFAGDLASFAVKADGSLWAWGANFAGQLGDGTTTSRFTPVLIGTNFVSVSAKNVTTMGLKTDGSLWIWGTNELYSIPDPSIPASLVPRLLDSNVTAFALSSHHGAYIKTDGTMKAWGHNAYGQNGTGDTNDAPYPIDGPSGFTGATITCGWDFNVSVRPDGSLWTWGFNHVGQIGDGTYNSRLAPFQVGTGYRSGIAGYGHTVAVRTDGTLWFWGAMYQIGISYSVPTQLGTGFNGKLAGGNDYLLAAKDDGTVWAAGPNDFGQLGTGTFNSSGQMQRVLLP